MGDNTSIGSSEFSATILICTCNRARSLSATLQALAQCTVPAGNTVELLVVDNASADDTKAVVGDYVPANMSVRYVYEAVRGQANARNAGVAAARGDIIIFTDDDVVPSHDWIVHVLDCYTDPQVAAVLGKIDLRFDSAPPDWLQKTHRSLVAEADFGPDRIFPFDRWLIGANMSFRASVARISGPFIPLLGPGASGFADDTEYSERLKRMGFLQLYEPAARVEHLISGARLTRAYYRDVAFRLGVSRSIILAQNGSPSANFHPGTLLRATLKDLSRRLRAAIRRETYYGTDPHLWYINYLGIAWGNFLGLERLTRRYSACEPSRKERITATSAQVERPR